MSPDARKTRNQYLLRTYAITIDEFDALVEAADGVCPICLKVPKTWVVDHDHRTKAVRGVLCSHCNWQVIGRHRDADVLERAATFLRCPPATSLLGERKVPVKVRKRNGRRSGSVTRTNGGGT